MSPTGPAPRACPEWEPLLVEDASGALPPEDARRLAVHAAGCPGCHAEAALLDEVFSLATLPPPSAAERRLVAGAAGGTLERWKRMRGRARAASAFAAALAVAAAAVVVAASPGLLRKAPPAPATAGEQAWAPPDLDALWAAAALADLADGAGSAASGGRGAADGAAGDVAAGDAAAGDAAAGDAAAFASEDGAAAYEDELVVALDAVDIYDE
jgi:hypothetical protein